MTSGKMSQLKSLLRAHEGPLTEELVSLRSLAQLLFTTYMLPFQLIGLLLLAAVVGATVLARRPTADEAPPTEAKP